MTGETAYITGGASGIGKATAERLVKKGLKVFIADRNTTEAQSVVDALNTAANAHVAWCTTLDAAEWNSQVKAFAQALSQFNGRIDHVFPIAGIGERRFIPKMDDNAMAGSFERPDLTVLDVDLNGVLYTISLAVQQFRRQDVGENGFRGKIHCVASTCGFYCVPTLPIYTAAKHGLTGFIRSYGTYLPRESITLNAVNPHVIRTNISTGPFYDTLEQKNLLTPIEGVIDTFESLIDGDERKTSGEIFEVGPNYGKNGEKGVKKGVVEFLDRETEVVFGLLGERGLGLQVPR